MDTLFEFCEEMSFAGKTVLAVVTLVLLALALGLSPILVPALAFHYGWRRLCLSQVEIHGPGSFTD